MPLLRVSDDNNTDHWCTSNYCWQCADMTSPPEGAEVIPLSLHRDRCRVGCVGVFRTRSYLCTHSVYCVVYTPLKYADWHALTVFRRSVFRPDAFHK